MKEWLYGKTLTELKEIVSNCGMPAYTAKQIAQWLYKSHALDIASMTNISAANRALLAEKYEVGFIAPQAVQTSKDGTKKYLFPTLGGKSVESAYIPDKERATLCVSSQAGCKMGCEFCMTARQGFQHHLTAGEILNQIRSIPERDKLTNVVYMGMGEPMDNIGEVLRSLEILTSDWGYGWSPTRITVSTIGVLPALKTFLEGSKVHLAVSMHNPFSEERLSIMPAEKKHSIADVITEIKKYDFTHQRRVSFEYIMFAGVNDTMRHAKEIVRLTSGLKCRFNLIRFHSIPGSKLKGADETTMVKFRDYLTSKGVTTTIRASRGEDISAACGMLSTLESK